MLCFSLVWSFDVFTIIIIWNVCLMILLILMPQMYIDFSKLFKWGQESISVQ